MIKWVIQDTVRDRKNHSRDTYSTLVFINLFASLTKLKFSCDHEYMNKAAKENAHWRADKMGLYQ